MKKQKVYKVIKSIKSKEEQRERFSTSRLASRSKRVDFRLLASLSASDRPSRDGSRSGSTFDSYGFTLFEALVAIGMFLLAVFAIAEFIRQGYQFQSYSFEGERIIASAQRGVETFVKEVRETSQSQGGAYPIERADQYELIFFADFDRDNSVERIRYFIQDGSLKKGVIDPTGNPISYPAGQEQVTTISDGVMNVGQSVPMFRYYNGDWPGDTVNNPLPVPANPTQVKLVKIILKINILPNQAPKEFELVSEVAIRNLKENL